jgi:GH25 family lysozyme M1 (1,4-beta-N-acetylmuramidase)
MNKIKFFSIIIFFTIIFNIYFSGVNLANYEDVQIKENDESEVIEQVDEIDIKEKNDKSTKNNEDIKETNQQTDLSIKKEENINQIIENGTYTISSAMNSNLVLDISGNSMDSGANVLIWNKSNQNNQKFNITYLENGYYKMEVVTSGKYLSGTSLNAKNEDNVIQSTYKDLDTQKWFIKDAGNGYYYIISKSSSLYLDIYGGKSELGTNVQLYEGKNGINQKFRFNKIDVVKGNKVISEGTYNISSALDFNQVLDVSWASQNNNANIEIYTRNMASNQKFKFQYTDDGYYKIVAIHSGKVLTVKSSSITPGANVEQYEDLGLDAQKWVIKSAGDGYYYIISKCNGLYLDLQGGISNSGTNIEVYTPNNKAWQRFKFYSTEINAKKTIDSGNYIITSALNSNKVIDIENDVISNNVNVDIWERNNQNNQKFIITYLDDGYYTIKAFNSNKVLTVKNKSVLNGSNVVQAFYDGSDAQKWAIVSVENGYYNLVSKSSGLVLDIQGATSANGSNIEVYEKNGGNNQKFKFVKTEFSSTIENGKYAILASSDINKVLDIEWGSSEDGANLELWSSNGGTGQSFNIEYIGNGYYTIEAACSRKLLTVKGKNVIQQEDEDLEEQKWVIQKADTKGNYSFRNKSNDYYLDIYYNNMENGTNIEIYQGNDEYSQKFKLEELEYKGIDVSKYQKDIEWNKVRTQIDFAIIRAGYRGSVTGKIAQDQYYSKNIVEALENGVNCGVYFFSQAINEQEGIEEAKWILEKIKGYDIKYPIAIDTEWSSDDKTGRADWISNEDRTAAMKGFCKTIKNAGYTPIIYASKNWIKDKLNINELEEYDIWLAHYVIGAPDKKSDYTGEYSIWQYTSSGRVDGINGEADINICYKKYI